MSRTFTQPLCTVFATRTKHLYPWSPVCLRLKFLDGPARQDRPVKHNLDELPETWYIVFNGPDTDGKKTAVYEQVSTNEDGPVGPYRHPETLEERRRN